MRKKFLAFMLTMVMLLSLAPIPVQAAVIGTNGSIPAGGSPGPGGGITLTPLFRVGLIDEVFRAPLELDEGGGEITPGIKQHYVNHFPNIPNPIIFAPAGTYSTATTAILGRYKGSNGSFDFLEETGKDKDGGSIQSKILRRIDGIDSREQNVFFDDLKARVDPAAGKQPLLGVWKEVYTTRYSIAEMLSEKVWTYRANHPLSGWS